MAIQGNGVGRSNGSNGAAQPAAPGKSEERRPRRLVLVDGTPDGPAAEVLAEYRGAEVSGNRLHADLQQQAEDHPGRYVAAEWLGPRGWTRFLWRRK